MIIINDEIKIRCTVAGSKIYEILPEKNKIQQFEQKGFIFLKYIILISQ